MNHTFRHNILRNDQGRTVPLRSWRFIVVLLTLGFATVFSVRSAIHCPGKPSGPSYWIQPSPYCVPGQSYPFPECTFNELDGGKQMGLCVGTEEPAHCEDGHGVVSAKKYVGKCVGDYQCEYILYQGQKVYLEDNAMEMDWSAPYALGCAG